MAWTSIFQRATLPNVCSSNAPYACEATNPAEVSSVCIANVTWTDIKTFRIQIPSWTIRTYVSQQREVRSIRISKLFTITSSKLYTQPLNADVQ